jgi:putative Ca2+/H+ antiporter (TMEM165/GDT1 family)
LRLFLEAYSLIFLAELPDKTALSTVMLAARRRHLAVFAGAACALIVQTGVAVAFGGAIGLLPRELVRYGAAALFVFVAVTMWREADERERAAADDRAGGGWWADARTAFLVIFLAEWGDLTQLSTAALVARHRAPAPIFFGAALALCSVSGLAVLLGSRLKAWLNPKVLHRAGAVVFALVGLSLLIF